MKKVLFLFLVLVVGKGFGQSVIFADDFNSAVFTFSPSAGSDWAYDNSPMVYPACSVLGSSGTSKLIGQQVVSGTVEHAISPSISTNTFVNIQVSWNMIRATASSPALSFQWTNDGITWNTVSYTAPPVGSWGAISPIALPASASGTNISVRWVYTSVGGFIDYIGIDDVNVSGTPSPSYYWNGVGALDNVASWGINTNGSGGGLSSFTVANTSLFIQNAPTSVLSNNWTVSGANTVLNIGDGTVGNVNNFTIPSSFNLTLGSGAVIKVSNNSTLTLQNASIPAFANVILGSNSTVNYAQTSAVTLWAATYGNLILSGSGNRNQSTGSTIVNGAFVIGTSNNYVMANSPGSSTQLLGLITCNGNITAGVSNLTIDGPSSNSIGTLNFNGTTLINNLTLNRSGQTLTLGTNLGFSGVLAQTTQFLNGNLNLNGKHLTVNGPVTFPATSSNGVFVGSTTSSLSITGTGAINNSLLMDQSSSTSRTSAFIINRPSATLVLGNDIIMQTAVFTNGQVNLNNQSLTLNGVTTFPTSASNSNFIGSPTSSLFVIGSGAITNSFFMDQTSTNSKSLGSFQFNRNGQTLTLGNNLITAVAGFTNGNVSLNGTHLTISGAINFPPNAARGFIGSQTSSLTIDGTGSITGSLFMNSANTSLSEFTMNRSLTTVMLGSTMETYGTIYPNSGTIASNGNLFIRSSATQKGRIAEVLAGASITGNIRVETFAASGNTDWTNLGVSGALGQTLSNWDGQIPMSCSGCINSETSAGGYFVSVQGWDETAAASSSVAYVEQTSASPLTPGKGFWVYLGDNIGTTSDITWTVTGNPVIGPVNVSLTNSGPSNGDGMNLISNPFPSPISWDAVLASNSGISGSLDGGIYIYNPDVNAFGDYAFGTGNNGVTGTISMGQGFYTEAFAPVTLTFQESNKIKSNAPLLKTYENYGSIIKLKVNDVTYRDETTIRFHQEATADFDRKMDSKKLYASPGYLGYPGTWTQRTTISTLSNDKDYSINSLPYANTADAVIPVLVKVYATGQHTITGTDLENLPNSCVILKDKLLNTTHDLKSGGYVCNISDTTTTPRFELRICMDVAMSVDENKSIATDNSIMINNDENGMYVKFDYKQATKSKISVTNVLGQKIVDDKSLTTINDKVYLNLDAKQQIVFITVSNENQRVTKKVVR